jgi:hypothetical protein
MNQLDDKLIDESSFSFQDIQGRDLWETFSVVFGSLTVVGATSYSGRLRFVGHKCEFQVQFSAATSIASVAGTDYLTLPVTSMGLAGMAVMTNDTTNVAVGVCHIDVATSRCYLPAQVASANVFTLAGWFEV